MHIQTHVMSGWCVGNYLILTGRDRFLCMLAASLPDLDGLGYFVSAENYWQYHHRLCHNLPFGLLLSGVLAGFASKRLRSFGLFLSLFHLHLLLDYFGSGPDWEIFYLWPFSNWFVANTKAWPFYSWQNISTGFVFVGWTVWIAVRMGRTPLEIMMPALDGQLVKWLRHRLGQTTGFYK